MDPLYRLGWIYSWMFADCNGVIEYRPKRLKADLFPYDDVNIEIFVAACAQAGFFVLFQVDNHCYIQITKFVKHQNPHKQERAAGSELPEHTSPEAVLVQSVDGLRNYFRTASEVNVLIPDSLFLIPDSLLAPLEGTQTKNGKPRQLPNGIETQIGLWLDGVAQIIPGAQDGKDLADYKRWREVVEQCVRSEKLMPAFLKVCKSEFDRTRDNPQFFTPYTVLKAFQVQGDAAAGDQPKRKTYTDYEAEVMASMEADRAGN